MGHVKNIDGMIAPSKEEQDRLGLNNVIIALANIVEVLENATTKG